MAQTVREAELSLHACEVNTRPHATPAAREAALMDSLETLGLRPRHGRGTLESWDDAYGFKRVYRQTLPREEVRRE